MAPERGQTLARASDSANRAGGGYAPPQYPIPSLQVRMPLRAKRCPRVLKTAEEPPVPSKLPRALLWDGRPLNLQPSRIQNSDPLRPHTVSPKLCHSYLPLNIKFLFLMQNRTINRLSQTKLKCPLLSSGERGGGGCLIFLNKQTRLGN